MSHYDKLNFRKKRNERGWTQKYVGECCGVSMQTVCDWEKGRRTLSLDYLAQLIQLFDVPHEELIGLFEPANSNQE